MKSENLKNLIDKNLFILMYIHNFWKDFFLKKENIFRIHLRLHQIGSTRKNTEVKNG